MINECHLPIQFIIDSIKQGSSAIILVDSLILNCTKCSEELKNYSDYVGHYIFLVGYTNNKGKRSENALSSTSTNGDFIFLYLDPAYNSNTREISATKLDLARLHPATDEDIILIQ